MTKRKQLDLNSNLSQQQESVVLTALETYKNMFITGGPGVGKTHVLLEIIRNLNTASKPLVNDNEYVVSATTGAAAVLLGGWTLHSECGLMVNGTLGQVVKRIIGDLKLFQKLYNLKVLIIDEVSQLHAITLDLLDAMLRAIKLSNKPFGGVQLIFCGDFMQLAPVPMMDENRNKTSQYCFESDSWKNAAIHQYELSKVFRQGDKEKVFLDILSAARVGETTDAMDKILNNTRSNNIPPDAPFLYSRNEQVNLKNTSRLNEIPGDILRFNALDSFHSKSSQTAVDLKKILNDQTLAHDVLSLKVGATVMHIKNDRDKNLVNGSMGKMISYDEASDVIEVEFSGSVKKISRFKFHANDKSGNEAYYRNQFPSSVSFCNFDT